MSRSNPENYNSDSAVLHLLADQLARGRAQWTSEEVNNQQAEGEREIVRIKLHI